MRTVIGIILRIGDALDAIQKKIIYQFASTHKFAYCFSIDSMRCGDLLYPIQFTTCILRKQCRAM